jgi:hypothetical protein
MYDMPELNPAKPLEDLILGPELEETMLFLGKITYEQLHGKGWIQTERRWIKATVGHFLLIEMGRGITKKLAAEDSFYEGKEEHAIAFERYLDYRGNHMSLGKPLSFGEHHFAEVSARDGREFNERPMTREELDEFYREFQTELTDFPDGIRDTVTGDLNQYYQTAVGILSKK